MAELKTKPTNASVEKFINQVGDETRREDCRKVARMMEEITGEKPKMWGPGIVGFGTYHYKYASGHEGDWPIAAFSPRKQDLTLYLMPGFQGQADLMQQLGKHRTGKSCLYIKRLSDVHVPTLKKLIRESVKQMRKIVKEKSAADRKDFDRYSVVLKAPVVRSILTSPQCASLPSTTHFSISVSSRAVSQRIFLVC